MMLDSSLPPHSSSTSAVRFPSLSTTTTTHTTPTLKTASLIQHADKDMNDMSDLPPTPASTPRSHTPQSNSNSNTSPVTTHTGGQKRTHHDTEEELAESVMNWDLGGGEGSRGTKRKTTILEPEKEVKELVVKLQKLTHDTHKVDGIRCIHVKFAPGVILKAKKLFQEPWGTMVSALEAYEALEITVGQKFWTRWDGETTPYTSLPIYHAVHSVSEGRSFNN